MGAFDTDFGSALGAAASIRAKSISSLELTEHTFRRIDAFQPKINAYVYQLREEALAAARRADDVLARGGPLGVFHGGPIQIVGPYLEDATPIVFADLLAHEIGGFRPPAGYGPVPRAAGSRGDSVGRERQRSPAESPIDRR
jgi:hypothetical protein